MSDFLEQVVASRRGYVAESRQRRSADSWRLEIPHNSWTRKHIPAIAGQHFEGGVGNAFDAALVARRKAGRLGVIAEVKRVSPALGVLATQTLDVTTQVMRYDAGGAAAISVLTEPKFWGGSIDDLRAARAATELPILCKDVIVDEYQIYEARAAGADAILLIAEALTDEQLHKFRRLATEMSMGTLVEAHEAIAFGRATEHGLVVGVNARNLRRPQEIDIGRARQLHSFAKPGQILVAESGISSADDARLLPARVDAVLVGTALMRAADPAVLLSALTAIPREPKPEPILGPMRVARR